jgi:hypothetical protein
MEVVILTVIIFTQGAEKLMCVCLCVWVGGYSGSNNFYTGCRKTNVCVFVCLWRGESGSIDFYTGCRKNQCVCVFVFVEVGIVAV